MNGNPTYDQGAFEQLFDDPEILDKLFILAANTFPSEADQDAYAYEFFNELYASDTDHLRKRIKNFVDGKKSAELTAQYITTNVGSTDPTALSSLTRNFKAVLDNIKDIGQTNPSFSQAVAFYMVAAARSESILASAHPGTAYDPDSDVLITLAQPNGHTHE